MKKEDLRALFEEHMVLSKRFEELREELENTEDRIAIRRSENSSTGSALLSSSGQNFLP
jgi:hypothetical protein